jgi:hypothetical protein
MVGEEHADRDRGEHEQRTDREQLGIHKALKKKLHTRGYMLLTLTQTAV